MRRREFITFLGGTMATVPLAARAQQSSTVRRVGVLMTLEESDPEAQTRVKALQESLKNLGWTLGRNMCR